MLHWLLDFFAPSQLGRGILVEIYSKPDCHLCEVAKAKLEELRRRWHFELREVNIALDDKLLQEFGERIPLVWVAGKLACKYRVEEEPLRKKLEQAAAALRTSQTFSAVPKSGQCGDRESGT